MATASSEWPEGDDASVQSWIELTQTPPCSILVFDPHSALLRMLVRYFEEHHAGMLMIAGAAFREADALVLAAAER